MRTLLAFTICVAACATTSSLHPTQPHVNGRGLTFTCPVRADCPGNMLLNNCTNWAACTSPFQPGTFKRFTSSNGVRYHVFVQDEIEIWCRPLPDCSERDQLFNEGVFCADLNACTPVAPAAPKPAS